MTSKKSFQITDLNNKEIIGMQKVIRENGNTVKQADIINLALELFFREKDDDYSNLMELMRMEHIL